MKLASLKSKNRDGELIVVSKDLRFAVNVSDQIPHLQYALDHWYRCEKELLEIYEKLNAGIIKNSFSFDETAVSSPLPRAYQWADGSAYVNHVELVRKARGATMPEDFWTNPLIYQGGSDDFIAPRDPILAADESYGIDFEAEIAVVVDDVPMQVTPEEAKHHIKLLMLVNDVSLRNLVPQELAKGFGFFQSKPATSFSPVAITPDELELAWDGTKVHLPLVSHFNHQLFGKPNAGVDMTFDFPTLIAHAAKTRYLRAGSIIGSGTVSNSDKSTGSSCIVEKRMLETLEQGQPVTDFMKFGDHIRIEMFDIQGQSLFGAIEQTVVQYHKSR